MTDEHVYQSRLLRSVVRHSSMTAGDRILVLLIVLSLAVVALLMNSACSPQSPAAAISTSAPIAASTGTPTRILYTRVPTSTPDTPTPTPTPTPFPPVTLEAPEDGSCLDCGTPVALQWSHSHGLQANEHYRLEVDGPGLSPFYHTTETSLSLDTLSPGEYNWGVTVVGLTDRGRYEPVSWESDRFSFEIAEPIPIVHTIWPTSTCESVSVTVVITGENFTHSTIIVIDVPLQTTLVDSSTITVTIPTTLDVGEYPVVVRDSTGEESASSVFFTVDEPIPTVTPGPVISRYAAPVLVEAHSTTYCTVIFKWEWPGTLAENEWFAVRVGAGSEEPRSKRWVKERSYEYYIGDRPGDYSWAIAICQGHPGDGCPQPLAISERGAFSFQGCGTDR